MEDIRIIPSLKRLAKLIGKEIALSGVVLVFGLEGDHNSLPQIAAKSAELNGGKTIAFIWGRQKQSPIDLNSFQIITGQARGGGREYSLVLSCDAVICIGGGSGTLTEIAMAYQVGIPIIVLKKTGGWSEKLAGQFLDQRKRLKIIGVKTAKEAVTTALQLIKNKAV